jgi:hypothetical protein
MGWDEVLSAREDQWGLNVYMEFELTIVANGLAKAYGYFTVVVPGRARRQSVFLRSRQASLIVQSFPEIRPGLKIWSSSCSIHTSPWQLVLL